MNKKTIEVRVSSIETVAHTDFDAVIYDLDKQIELLSSQADKWDYLVAVASGILCGMLDILWVGDFSLENGRAFASDKVDGFVEKTAKILGFKGDDLKDAVKFLEDKFPIPSDGNTPDFGGGLQHHLRDFAHHPTIVGLVFSLLTQFTGMSYGTDVNGVFKIVPVPDKSKAFIGKDIPDKLFKVRSFGSFTLSAICQVRAVRQGSQAVQESPDRYYLLQKNYRHCLSSKT